MSEQEERYKAEEVPIQQWYRKILETRWETAKALNAVRSVKNNLQPAYNVEDQIMEEHEVEKVFKNYLDMYYDLTEEKFGKNNVEKPEFIKKRENELKEWEVVNIQDLELDKAIYLYKQINRLLEELKVTSLENKQFQRKKV